MTFLQSSLAVGIISMIYCDMIHMIYHENKATQFPKYTNRDVLVLQFTKERSGLQSGQEAGLWDVCYEGDSLYLLQHLLPVWYKQETP